MYQRIVGCGAMIIVMLAAERAHGEYITFGLGTPTVAAGSATFDVTVDFAGADGDLIEVLQLSLLGSDPLLTENDTDFNRFSFLLDGIALPGWQEFVPVSLLGIGLYAPLDPISGPFLGPTTGPTSIGTLNVALAGITPGTALLVTLAGGPPGLQTDAGGTIGGVTVELLSSNDMVAFNNPEGVPFTAPETQGVPEPSSFVAMIAMGGLVMWVRTRKRGALSTVYARSG